MRLFICALATFFICAMRPALWRDYESKRGELIIAVANGHGKFMCAVPRSRIR
jgi:hypothetical protein